jgi:hypothetical protein
MRVSLLGRLLAATALACSFGLAAAGGASAATPRWSMSVTDLPAVVHNGSNAGYQVTISNAGPSNISTLFLVTQTQASPTYVSTPTQGTCSAPGAGPLVCNFGALTAGSSVTVTVAYATPATGTSFDPVFQGNSNGATFSDSRATSHGDTLQDPNETPTQLTTSRDFAGGFAVDQGTVGDDAAVGKNNIQATSVIPPASGIVTTVQDGLPNTAFSCGGACAGKTLFGDWSRVTVDKGQAFGDLFPVTLLIYGQAVPNKTPRDQIQLAHVFDDGSSQALSTTCGATPTLNCITVTPVGNNVKITAWVNQNGGVRGMR